MLIKKIMLFLKYGYKSNSKSFIKYLRKRDITIGNNTKFHSPWTISVDMQRPWMIEFGSNVVIGSHTSFLQHGYDWAVLQKKYGVVLGSAGQIKIGNNVFIGTHSTFLKGVTIGDDIIIGANSLVNKNCLMSGVYAGNPVKYICSLDEYLKKRMDLQLTEAVDVAKNYYIKYKVIPPIEIFREFFWLFENDFGNINVEFKKVFNLGNNFEMTFSKFKQNQPQFKNYNEFIEYALKEELL